MSTRKKWEKLKQKDVNINNFYNNLPEANCFFDEVCMSFPRQD